MRGGRISTIVLTVILGGAALSVFSIAPAGAALSDDDCEVVTTIESSADSSSNEREALAAQAEGYADAAQEVSDKKLKKGLVRLADVYEEASKAKTAVGAGVVLVERAKDYAKGFKVYAKALNECTLRTLSTLATLPRNITIPSIPR